MQLRRIHLKKSLLCPISDPAARLASSKGIYLILDRPKFSGFSLKKIRSLVSGKEIGLIQIRDKSSAKKNILKFAKRLARLLRKNEKLFIINDHVDVAKLCGADGVHLGQEDLSLKQARKVLGKNRIIGISCHNLRQALKAQKDGADYIGIGPIYKTATKPGHKPIGLNLLRLLKDRIKIPYFAIGNIHEGNIKEIAATGTRRIAVCRAILKADNPKRTARQLFERLK